MALGTSISVVVAPSFGMGCKTPWIEQGKGSNAEQQSVKSDLSGEVWCSRVIWIPDKSHHTFSIGLLTRAITDQILSHSIVSCKGFSPVSLNLVHEVVWMFSLRAILNISMLRLALYLYVVDVCSVAIQAICPPLRGFLYKKLYCVTMSAQPTLLK